MDTSIFVSHALGAADQYKYLLIFIGNLFEGPIIMVASGFLLHFGVFHLPTLYITLVFADLLADVIWYHLGRYYATPLVEKYGKFFSLTPELFDKAKRLMEKYHEKIFILSKITIGFGLAIPIIVVAGSTRISFSRFIFFNFIGELVLVAMLLSIGYFFGNIYSYIENGFKIIFLVGTSCLLAAGLYGFTKYMKNKALKN